MAGSMGRTERTGPTSGASWEWKTARNRVTPPSTTSSYTMSAASRPAWGRAAGELSILTTSAGRRARAGSSTGWPVRGKTAPLPGAVVVVAGFGAVVLAAACSLEPPLQAADSSPSIATRAVSVGATAQGDRRDGDMSQLPECGDPLVERGVGVEEPVDPDLPAPLPFLLGGGLLDPEMGGGPRRRVDHGGVVPQLLE